jgi:dienelactone hydrolase
MARIGLSALVVLAIAAARPADAEEPAREVSFPAGSALALRGQLHQPSGAGPFPAVVLMHGCEGMLPGMARMEKVALLLRDAGYVVLVVDGFGPRGVQALCDDTMLIRSPDPRARAEDAVAARRYLSSLAVVASSRVGLVGWAHGGTAALMAWARGAAADGAAPFAAVAAYYPTCGLMGLDIRSSSTPLLIFVGERDDVVSPSGCRSLVDNANQIRRRDVAVQVYPGATHLFDGPPGGTATTSGRHTYAPGPDAARDSRERLLAFLGRTLRE